MHTVCDLLPHNMDPEDTPPSKHDDAPMDLDELLPQVGEFGRYQKIMLWFVCLPACIPCGFSAFNQLFMTDIPPHWCSVPELAAMSPEQRRELAIPKSIFDLVCNRDIYPTLGLVALNLGSPIGVYVFGWLNDQFGRRMSFFTCLATVVIGNLLTAAATNFWWWAGSRVIVGLTVPAIYQIPFIIALELVGPNYRSFVTFMTCIFYTFGLMLLAGVTYLIRNWVHLALATSVPFMLYSLYWFFLPESPRWLLARGHFERALEILENLAKYNKKKLPDSFRHRLKQKMMMHRTQSEEKRLKNSPGVMALCRTPNMRLKTALITLNWFANETVYVGLSYYGPALGSNQYLSFLLSSAVEIPSYFLCWFIMDRWGRRWPLCLCMTVSGLSCMATVLVPAEAVVTTLVLFLISKSAISASFLVIYPYAGELYPTQLRGIGIGTSAYVGGLGLIMIPFVTYLGSENLVIPLVIMGAISIIGGLSGLRLPETLYHRLPQTVEEGEEFGKDWTIKDCLRCVPLRPSAEASYEDLELEPMKIDDSSDAEMPPSQQRMRRVSMRRLVRQSSTMDTQKDSDGTMKMTYWF